MFWTAFVILQGILLLLGLAALYIFWQLMRLPADRPAVFLKSGRPDTTKSLVVCTGDSITHGAVSVNYINKLRERRGDKGYEFVNAGVNGELAYGLLKRLDEIVACQPDFVTVLIGTNDVNATLSRFLETFYMKRQKLPTRPTIEWYRESIRKIVTVLKQKTRARIALLSLPVLGEDLNGVPNQRISAYNEVIRGIAEAEGVTYLPLYEKQTTFLRQHDHKPRLLYEGKLGVMFRVLIQRFLLGRSWDDISAANGFLLLTDHIHMNSRGAAMIADLIEGFLTGNAQ